jgi:hypothetical protein
VAATVHGHRIESVGGDIEMGNSAVAQHALARHVAQSECYDLLGALDAASPADQTSSTNTHGIAVYRFLPLSVETLGRLGKPLMILRSKVEDLAAYRAQTRCLE